ALFTSIPKSVLHLRSAGGRTLTKLLSKELRQDLYQTKTLVTVAQCPANNTEEREQVVAMSPQVLGQALVGRVGLGREEQGGQLVRQAAAGHGLAVPADLPRRVTVAQVQPSPEQLGHPSRETHRPARRHRLHLVATPQQVLQALLMVSTHEPVV